ncbi:MAG: hypothetical protein OEY27_03765 [Gammaproteobacteria bacterium]|nr:hypothetical protein [Gammaproteobacteria bacterium]
MAPTLIEQRHLKPNAKPANGQRHTALEHIMMPARVESAADLEEKESFARCLMRELNHRPPCYRVPWRVHEIPGMSGKVSVM